MKKETLYERIKGRETLEKVHKIFYDKLYQHPIFSLFFKGIQQDRIEKQQTDFMSEAMQGPKDYFGKFPVPAHKHMFITKELFQDRHALLRAALLEGGVQTALAEEWLAIDAAFESGIVKNSIEDCEKRFATDEILVVDLAGYYKKSA